VYGVEKEFSGKGYCPYNPRHNSTSIFTGTGGVKTSQFGRSLRRGGGLRIGRYLKWKGDEHRLNMELNLQSLFGLRVQLYLLAETPYFLPPSPAFWLIYESAIGHPR
jgi:hypothetical protein